MTSGEAINTEKLLLSLDSAERRYPPGFNFEAEDERAHELARKVEELCPLRALVEDYSLNQDGSRFLRIALFYRPSVSPVGEIQISSFGRLVTLVNVFPQFVGSVIELTKECGYTFIDLVELDKIYSGSQKFFLGRTWYSRYFQPFYGATR